MSIVEGLKERAGYLRNAEAARYLALSESTINHLRTSGGGPRFAKLGIGRNSRIVYRREDLDRWAEERTYTSTSAYPVAASAGGRG